MKYLLFLLAILLSGGATANELTFDPTLSGETTLTLTCEYPIEREDNTPLAIGEIAKVKFFVEKDGVGGFVPAGENATACKQIYDVTQIVDGVYVYKATVVDTDGRESVMSTDFVTAMVKRLANPKSTLGLTGSKS